MAELRQEFLAVFPELVTEILAGDRESSDVQYIADALNHVEKVGETEGCVVPLHVQSRVHVHDKQEDATRRY